MTRENVQLPQPYRWPNPITAEHYQMFTPDKLELIDGYLVLSV